MRLRGGSANALPVPVQIEVGREDRYANLRRKLEDGGSHMWLEAWKLAGKANRAASTLNQANNADCKPVVACRAMPAVPRFVSTTMAMMKGLKVAAIIGYTCTFALCEEISVYDDIFQCAGA